MFRRALRIGLVAVLAIAAITGAAQLGRLPGLATTGAILLLGIALLWLPRAAHRAFRGGDVPRARLLYRILRTAMIDPWARAASDVSLAACELSAERYADALAALDRVDPAFLSEPARAAWLNNRAYAMARLPSEPEAALRCITEAIDLRPQVAGFRHTRGIALLALGRIDEAIRELDAVWKAQSAEDDTPLLEAERCYDLGVAWSRKGERDYAIDYFDRARKAAPGSLWAQRALAELPQEGMATASPIADVV